MSDKTWFLRNKVDIIKTGGTQYSPRLQPLHQANASHSRFLQRQTHINPPFLSIRHLLNTEKSNHVTVMCNWIMCYNIRFLLHIQLFSTEAFMHVHVWMDSCVSVCLCVFLHMCERATSWVMNQVTESQWGDKWCDVCNHDGAMAIVMEKEREREREDRTEVMQWERDSKGQMPGDGQGEVWGKLQCSCIAFSLYWCSRFTLTGDWLLWHDYDCGLQWTMRRERGGFWKGGISSGSDWSEANG